MNDRLVVNKKQIFITRQKVRFLFMNKIYLVNILLKEFKFISTERNIFFFCHF